MSPPQSPTPQFFSLSSQFLNPHGSLSLAQFFLLYINFNTSIYTQKKKNKTAVALLISNGIFFFHSYFFSHIFFLPHINHVL
ncbi:hypothetical protein EDB83DRAFT_2424283 [Lactarius deliciosus]|nr:hypothetical protein EDB83DRAFT_2424283 [Lactarius deliciosus]